MYNTNVLVRGMWTVNTPFVNSKINKVLPQGCKRSLSAKSGIAFIVEGDKWPSASSVKP